MKHLNKYFETENCSIKYFYSLKEIKEIVYCNLYINIFQNKNFSALHISLKN